MSGVVEQGRIELSARLHSHRTEIEEATLTRVHAISTPEAPADPEYAQGLRAAVVAALDYGLAGIERGEERPPPIPAALLVQARLAARNGVSVDTVLRRYFAGYTILGDYLVQEGGILLDDAELRRLLRSQAARFDQLLAAVSEEHAREEHRRPDSSERRLTNHVQRLLAGELLDTSELSYDFDLWHLGGVLAGRVAGEGLRELSKPLDCRLLQLRRGEGIWWAWFGSRREPDPEELARVAAASLPPQARLAVGEPAEGLPGWRLTHLQAAAALPVAQRMGEKVLRYADVALLASILQDELLATSLRQIYLAPLERERDGGQAARETLHAYFAAGRNVSSAAAALKLNRNTVASRLQAIEDRIGRPLALCAAELEATLRLEALEEGLWAGAGNSPKRM
jgi:PucR-like helix-turn-helix protein/diguanylate cyclase with GGDEF domain